MIPTVNNQTFLVFNDPEKEEIENIVGKGENAGLPKCLPFQQCLLPYQRQIKTFQTHIFLVVYKCFQFGRVQNFIEWWRVKSILTYYHQDILDLDLPHYPGEILQHQPVLPWR